MMGIGGEQGGGGGGENLSSSPSRGKREHMTVSSSLEANITANNGGILSANDFGYSHLRNTVDDGLDDPAQPQDAPNEDPFSNVKYDKLNTRKWADGGENLAQGCAVGLFSCCCVLSLVLLILGGIFFGMKATNNYSSIEVAGIVLLSLGVLFFCSGIVFCCSACLLACGKGVPGKKTGKKSLTLKRLNDRFDDENEEIDDLRFVVGEESKAIQKHRKTESTSDAKLKKKRNAERHALIEADINDGLSCDEAQHKRRPALFKIVFDGDVHVSSIGTLREQISLCISAGTKYDIVCVIITSGGGEVTMYGLAAAQMGRVRKAGMNLIVCVDSVAASGGYLMATMANKIFASPFAYVGSIGVVSIIPNVQKLLEKHDISTYVFTAGKYKRTVDIVGDVTEEAKQKVVEELEEIHQVFKRHICLNRPALQSTIDDVATGEAWLAVQGKEKGLVDEIATSDEYLMSMSSTHDIIEIREKDKQWDISDLFEVGLSTLSKFGSLRRLTTLENGLGGRPPQFADSESMTFV